MTLEELSKELIYKPTYMQKHWTRICRYLAPKGIELIKTGRGAAAEYGIKLWNETDIRWETHNQILNVQVIASEKEFFDWNKAKEEEYANW